ncbi:hypothetical protein HYQ00_gp51 [Arthrobacter phage TripleJ]|uniref:Uncharacterized protein n=1 Tax=Arthrobacter phage TripleJ TaxID=2599838 RepID=A0A5J6TG11_9CAUD|nr:hypothetical protein HYQ00_gp51 [Arthrobacter phage TripleJ]QFG09595.1 hypothetical protein PBI_TRIPLEJ_51 [Arthrobacter phage TripleJ]
MSRRQPIRLTERGEIVLGTLAGLAFLFTITIFFAVLGDFLGI